MLCNGFWKKDIQVFENLQIKDELILNLNEIDSLFNREIFDVYGCLILDSTLDRSRKIKMTREQFEKVIQHYSDRTGYEYSNNEFRIIDYIEKDLTKEEQYQLSLIYIKFLNSRITLMTKNKITYVLFFEEDILQIRFYQEWNEEVPPYIENIEDIENPIAIYTSDELTINHRE